MLKEIEVTLLSGVKFIHAADLHLDSPFSGLKDVPSSILKELRESPFKAFQTIINEAISRQVDFIVLSGDLFDGENRSLRTQVRFRTEMEKLQQHQIPAYIIHGNHDHLSGSWITVELPDNVHVFSRQTEVKRFEKIDGTTVHLYGFSYPRRHVRERMIETYIKAEGADYHIGLLHGNLEGNTEHSPYAPFSLKELAAKDFDYWALGHIHKHQVVSEDPLVIYPGNIQGRNRKESGVKGCLLVELDGDMKRHSFIETSVVIWESETIEITAEGGFDALFKQCKEVIERKGFDGRSFLLELKLDAGDEAGASGEYLEELTRILQEEDQGESFVWVYKIKVIQSMPLIRSNETILPFMAEVSMLASEFDDADAALAPLYIHPGARRFLDSIGPEEQRELLDEAERWLLQVFEANK
ncbi:DNA repair exonuclease [Bacillus sp. ISL-34]|uniref:metallophosphoesterase family protein n=1 Tax=Bacillus sp. ISL-34 TaxID=2819121 RepID=UPI001BE9BFE2|nr:DNA repair exonuclease [Bacillus sp. ISL-34]MBT2645606.1 DNA repair exonuclease [Bacillus sp. ISL-34]